VAHNRLVLNGMAEFQEALRSLAPHLAQEAGPLVEGAANGAASDVKQGYGQHVVTGNLRDHVVVAHTRNQFGAISPVKSTSRIAFIAEYGAQAKGTVARHTKSGANRGVMRPLHIFVPAVVRARRRLTAQLIQIVERAGFTVRGVGGLV